MFNEMNAKLKTKIEYRIFRDTHMQNYCYAYD